MAKRLRVNRSARLRVEPSPQPVFLNGNLIIRAGHGKRKLTAQEAIAYQKQRWS